MRKGQQRYPFLCAAYALQKKDLAEGLFTPSRSFGWSDAPK